MQNAFDLNAAPADDAAEAARPEVTTAVTRGVVRLFVDLGLTPVLEFRLPNGRRADVVGLDGAGAIAIAEVKSCRADFDADEKWESYLEFCDTFYFAAPPAFPVDLLPCDEGLILADAYGGAVMREPQARKLAPARRKALTLRFARHAARRALGV